MFWNIFLTSLVLIIAIMIVGQIIASVVEGKSTSALEDNSNGEGE